MPKFHISEEEYNAITALEKKTKDKNISKRLNVLLLRYEGATIEEIHEKLGLHIICAINPLTTAVLGWLLMGDALGLSGIVGAVLILVGIILPNLSTCCRSADLYL